MDTRVNAIYARQSVDRLDSISIESQIEFCRYELRGEAYREYADRGFSGKNTSRPQFQTMLEDIRSGSVKRVVCYRLDRISRSVLDFANMIDELQRHHVEFVSCSEKFDTSTPMGRAMLNICIVFAQLERETIQQRVADAYHSRSLKGYYMGGRIPYGYRLEGHYIDGKRTSRYVINETEADVIRLMYALYAEPQTSVGDIIRYLDDHGVENPQAEDRHWNRSRVARILKNPVYLRADLDAYEFFQRHGAVLHNAPGDFIGTNGCYLYSDEKGGRKETCLEHQHIVLAPHEGIVPADIWIRARKKSLHNGQAARPLKAKNSWLCGNIKCGRCGYALTVKKARTQTGRYFICSRHLDSRGCEGVGGLDAAAMEQIVLEALKTRLRDMPVLRGPRMPPDRSRITEIDVEIAQAERDIAALMEKVPEAGQMLMRHINERIGLLDKRLGELICAKKTLLDEGLPRDTARDEIRDYMSRWDELTVSDKKTVVDALVISIRATQETVRIEWRI